MKRIKINIILIISMFSIVLFAGCDEISKPYTDDELPFQIDTNNKKVLIEDITGYTCGNCPEAAVEGHNLESKYLGAVIPIEVHWGSFAVPIKSHPEEYRCTESTQIGDDFKVVGTPTGMVNRKLSGASPLLSYSAWGSEVLKELQTPADVKIYMTPAWDESSKNITLNLTLHFLKDFSNTNTNLSVYIVEDSVIGFQKWYVKNPSEIEDYEHRNVLRGSFTGTYGEKISNEAITKGMKIQKSLNFKVPTDKKWDMSKIKLIAFVHNNETKEIMNVNWKSLGAKKSESDEFEFIEQESDTIYYNAFTGNTVLEWNAKVKNLMSIDKKITAGFKVKNLTNGHKVALCSGMCFLSTTKDFESPDPLLIPAGTTSADGILSLHVDIADEQTFEPIKGSSEIEFYFYPIDKKDKIYKKTVWFIAK